MQLAASGGARDPLSRPWAVPLLLAGLELAAFGIFSPRLGFYLDDWYFLEILTRHPGYWAGIHALLAKGSATRPVALLIQPLVFTLAGAAPMAFQCAMMALDWLGAVLFHRFVSELTGDRALALLSAALVVCLPIHPATHLWPSNMPQTTAQDLLLAGFIAHLRYVDTRSRRALLASMAFYLAGALCYESVTLLPAAMLLALALRGSPSDGAPSRRARAALLDTSPYAVPFGAAMLWQWAGARWVLHQTNPKAVHFSVLWAAVVYQRAVHSLVLGVPILAAIALASWRSYGAAAWLLMAAAGAAFGWAVSAARRMPRRGSGTRPALGAALGFFLAGYAPYALSGAYPPNILGVMSRTSSSGSFALALVLAAAALGAVSMLADGPRGASRLRGPVLAALTAALLATAMVGDWWQAVQWGKAWSLQQAVLARVEARAKALPKDSTLLLEGVPDQINGGVVFFTYWDWPAALRLRTGRQDLQGEVVPRKTLLLGDRIHWTSEGEERSVPLAGTYVYDFQRDSLFDLRAAVAARQSRRG
ncbi:MAG: hypothetical protein KGL53_14635 [Elusimicrobia bacterium]|nr:hypothetical protein [Elusimicrobiota bacterium]